MFAGGYIVNIVGVASMAAIIILSLLLLLKVERIKSLQEDTLKLKKSLNEMDEQAKLIVRTDMELNRTQEELDKKINGLYTLQRLSRAIGNTFEEEQIFKMIDSEHLEELGFEKAYGALWNDAERKFINKISLGYLPEEIEPIKYFLDVNKEWFIKILLQEKPISAITTGFDNAMLERIRQTFLVHNFILSPIIPREGNKGFLLIGTQKTESSVNKGDEELVNILTNQLGQTIENARLFEKTWHTQQELEQKVKERTSELTVALNEVQKISKRKTDFISSVSHELRTPLTSIKGYASILLAGKLGTIPAEVKERLEKINRHSDELVHLVNDLLDIARIESGKMLMRTEPCQLKDLAGKVTDLLSVQAKAAGIELITNISDDASNVIVDYSQIERVFINLIGNAIKFTPKKGKITVSSSKTGTNYAQVDISDTGCGIPEGELESIFEEFYRIDNPINQEVKGTGLGLSLVKHIIKAHKGEIWVKSKVGIGSTFSFTLPKSII